MAVNSEGPRFFPVPKNQMRETAKAAAAYRQYEAMGDERSLAKLALQYGKPTSYVRQLQRWSSAFHWQERVKKYEDRLGEEKRKKRQRELEKMDEEHASFGRTQALWAIDQIKRLMDAQAFGASASVSLFKAATDLERLARGAATNRIEGDVTMTVLPKEYINIAPDEEGSEP
jgi:hypothetical protein